MPRLTRLLPFSALMNALVRKTINTTFTPSLKRCADIVAHSVSRWSCSPSIVAPKYTARVCGFVCLVQLCGVSVGWLEELLTASRRQQHIAGSGSVLGSSSKASLVS